VGINVSHPTAVIQAKRGIGDVIWHLPFIRAIAAVSPGGQVTFLAPPSSGAKELLAAEPSVAETIYFQHAGSEFHRAVNLIRLVALLRKNRFRTLWILDRTVRPALAAMLAGIPERIGLGLGLQQWFITNSGIDASQFHNFPIEWLVALMAAMRVPVPTIEPELHLRSEILSAIGAKFGDCGRPWIVLGLGGSHPEKDWPDPHWAEFLAALRRRTGGTVFLIGGAENAARVQKLAAGGAGAPLVNGCDLKLDEAAALLQRADLFIGPDSGPMNIAAATATEAFALFGATKVLTNSKFIHAIEPPGGPSADGMRRILPAQVLERIGPYLSLRKARE
jgi:heptosyltransferase II